MYAVPRSWSSSLEGGDIHPWRRSEYGRRAVTSKSTSHDAAGLTGAPQEVTGVAQGRQASADGPGQHRGRAVVRRVLGPPAPSVEGGVVALGRDPDPIVAVLAGEVLGGGDHQASDAAAPLSGAHHHPHHPRPQPRADI